jgi:NAD(P)H-hydrate epimerase
MKKVLTAKEMQKIDAIASSHYAIDGLKLMENAGKSIVNQIKRRFDDLLNKKIFIFCGKGNNGGDGFVTACLFFGMGVSVTVILLEKRINLKGNASINAELAFNLGVTIIEIEGMHSDLSQYNLCSCDIIIDALLGTGLTRPVEGIYKQVVEQINQSQKFIASVDIPSGLDSDTGLLKGVFIRADLTIALTLPKRSHLLFPSAALIGELQIVDIGITSDVIVSQNIKLQVTEEADLISWFQKRPADSHKGSYGHVLVIAGSRGKGGSAGLTALAALRMGCGLVTLALPESCQKKLEFHPLEVMTVSAPETALGTFSLSSKEVLLSHAKGKAAVAIGPGISTEPETVQLINELLPLIDCPLIIDADGINAIAQNQNLISKLSAETILTPHPKEMSRISGIKISKILKNRVDITRQFALDHSVNIILKGASSIICQPDGMTTINPTGNPGMATAGTGDILTGVIASLIAQGFSSPKAAIAGTYLHGLTGDIYASQESQTSLIAGDLLRTLPKTIKRILH